MIDLFGFPIGNYKIAEPAQSKIKIIKSSSEILSALLIISELII